MKKRKVLILLPSFFSNDAVGNDVLMQRNLLKDQGCDVSVFAEHAQPALREMVVEKNEVMRILADPDVLAIIHHAIYWPGLDEIVENAKCTIWVRYHNVTPAHFFGPYSDSAREACHLGRQQTLRLAESAAVSLFVSASEYSARELRAVGIGGARSVVLPPFHRADEILETEYELPQGFNEDAFNVLFVGRISPNKGHKHLIEVIRYYREMFDENICLNIVGGYGADLVSYKYELDKRVQAYGLGNYIRFMDHLPFSNVAGLYRKSDVFLLMSEHEGFCVPILEAQISGLPVVAYAAAAVGETIGQQQLAFDGLDYSLYAAALYRLKESPDDREFLVRQGCGNVQRFSREAVATSFLQLLAERL